MSDLEIKVTEEVETGERLNNAKPWFNGLKIFSSVKVLPPTVE